MEKRNIKKRFNLKEKAIRKSVSRIHTDTKDSKDFSLPGYALPQGNIHPLEQVTDEIKSIFKSISLKYLES